MVWRWLLRLLSSAVCFYDGFDCTLCAFQSSFSLIEPPKIDHLSPSPSSPNLNVNLSKHRSSLLTSSITLHIPPQPTGHRKQHLFSATAHTHIAILFELEKSAANSNEMILRKFLAASSLIIAGVACVHLRSELAFVPLNPRSNQVHSDPKTQINLDGVFD